MVKKGESDFDPSLAPGSVRAIKAGCQCSREDNSFGIGFSWDEKRAFWICDECPIHGKGADFWSPVLNAT